MHCTEAVPEILSLLLLHIKFQTQKIQKQPAVCPRIKTALHEFVSNSIVLNFGSAVNLESGNRENI